MKRHLRIGFTYDVKEDYNFHTAEWKHSDFSTLAEVSYVKLLLERKGHEVILIGNYEKLYQALKDGTFPEVDIVLNTAEGINSRNREGWIPSLLEINHIPYSGSDAYGLGLTLSKSHTKIIAEHLGIPTPSFYEINSGPDAEKAAIMLKGPWILKPNYEGSSSGVRFVRDPEELKTAAEQLLAEYNQTILCESYIGGAEFNVSLLYDGEKTKSIGVVEIVRKDGRPLDVFDVVDKFTSTCTKIPAKLPEPLYNKLCSDTIKIHKYIGCLDYNRADYRIDENGNYYLLELNPLPSIDDESGFAKCCEYNGIKLADALEQVVFNALKRWENKQYLY